jgi:hypothetical protein
MKTSELTGKALNWAVGVAEGIQWEIDDPEVGLYHRRSRYDRLVLGALDYDIMEDWGLTPYEPSTNWAQGGPIIDKEDIAISPAPDGLCSAYKSDGTTRWLTKGGPTPTSGVEVFNWTYKQQGYTPLIAAMRCYVASKLGAEIDLPKELT